MSDILTVQETSLTAIADEIRKKTGKEDKLTFPAGFVSEIDSIQAGGGSAPAEEIKEKDVNFFDYDGTLIASYTEAEAKALTSLPTPPEHSGLTFQGWNYTLQEVIDNADEADIGALYTTDDGATRLEIEVLERRNISVRFSQTKVSGVLIDWGDGTSERSGTATGMQALVHNYAEPGEYTITLTIDDDCNVTLGSYSSNFIIISALGSNAAQNTLRRLYIGDRVVKIDKSAFLSNYALHSVSMNQGITAIGDECFENSSIEFIAIPSGIDTIPYSAFNRCRCLKNISLPVSVQNLDQYSIYQCNALRRLNLKNVTNPQSRAVSSDNAINKIVVNADIAYIPNYFCSDCTGLERVIFLGRVNTFYSGALSSCYSLKTVDLTHCEAVPTLQDTTIFSSPRVDLEILVPAALADEWTQATNWTKLANYIKGV